MATVTRLDLGGFELHFDRQSPHGSRFVQLAILDKNGQFKN